jgi:diguanylate cyclase (GGDEF)-like protein
LALLGVPRIPAQIFAHLRSAGRARAISLVGAWRLAGVLFIGGALSTIPALFLLEEPADPWVFALTAFAVAMGAVCLLIPNPPYDERWLAAIPVVGTIQVAIAVAATDYVFTYLYFLVALYAAVVFPRLREMAPYLGLIAIGLLLPFAYQDEPARQTALWLLAVAPGVLFIAIVVGRLTAHLEASREAYRRLSGEDGLTGVGNYRSMVEMLRHEIPRHRRHGREFTLLTLDLDNFKAVNEIHGHLTGDLVLAVIASTIELRVRTEDVVFRQGGDEFAVLAPETGREQAERLAERIAEALNQISSGRVQLSASIGMAVFPHDGVEPGELLDNADASLRYGKRGGGRLIRLPTELAPDRLGGESAGHGDPGSPGDGLRG